MIYIILPWSECIQHYLYNIEEYDKYTCPICYKDIDNLEIEDQIRHMKRCYCVREIKNNLLKHRHDELIDKYDVVFTTIQSVRDEMSKFIQI